MDKFVFLLELIGTVAFAASGSLTAMRRHMDLLGVIVLGVITSVGGGILRDVILGITPPLAFRDPTCTRRSAAACPSGSRDTASS